MGLDTSAYRGLSRYSGELNGDKEPVDADVTGTRLYPNPDFPARAPEIEDGFYQFDEHQAGIHYAYSAHSQFRELLAEIAGWSEAPDEGDEDQGYRRFPFRRTVKAWRSESGPFWELLNFSDCEAMQPTITDLRNRLNYSEMLQGRYPEDAVKVKCTLSHDATPSEAEQIGEGRLPAARVVPSGKVRRFVLDRCQSGKCDAYMHGDGHGAGEAEYVLASDYDALNEELFRTVNEKNDRIETLAARVAELEKDAARYRWLRDCGHHMYSCMETGGPIDAGRIYQEEELDEAVDKWRGFADGEK